MRRNLWGAVTAALVVLLASAPGAHAWTPARVVSSPDQVAESPVVDSGPTGRSVVAFSRRIDEGHTALQVRLREPGSAWGPVQDLSGGRDSNGFNPSIAVGPGGDAIVVWEADERNGTARAAFAPAGEPFGAPVSISDGHDAALPFVGLDAHGGAVALWKEEDFHLHYAVRPAGEAFTAENVIEMPPETYPNWPSYAVAGNGDAVAAWTTSGGDVYASLRPSGGSFAPARLVDHVPQAGAVRVAMGADGAAVAVWTSEGYPENLATRVAMRAPGAAGFGPPAPLNATAGNPVPAVSSRGEIAVVEGSWAYIRPAAGEAFRPERVAAGGMGSEWPPGVEYGPDGTLHVVWQQYASTTWDDIRAEVMAAERPPGGRFADRAATLATPTTITTPPSLAAGPDGTATAAWVEGFYGIGPVFAADRPEEAPGPSGDLSASRPEAAVSHSVPAVPESAAGSRATGAGRRARCHVPRLRGLSLARARARLVAHRCRVGTIRRARRATRSARVVAQIPRPGAVRARGHRVRLRLASRGAG